MMQQAAAALLVAALLGCLWLYLHRRWRWHSRRAALAAKSLLLFGASSLVALALLGRIGAVAALPSEFATLRPLAMQLISPEPPLAMLLGAVLTGTVLGGVFAAWRERRGRKWTLGNVEAVMPRTRVDLAWGLPLSLIAGVTEELFFRLALPLLLVLAGLAALPAFVVATLLFGYAHRYQGWIGMAATFVVGGLLAALYLSTASLLAVMIVHAAIDLNALVLRPLIAGRVRLFGVRP